MAKKIVSNPYIVGNPIKTKEMFFGREDDFAFIARKLGADKANQVIVLCGERRSGKTSILFQILNGRLGTAFVPMLVDMQILAGIKSDADFYKAVLETGTDQLKIPGLDMAALSSKAEGNAERMFREFVASVNKAFPDRTILFLLDEYELLEAKIKDGTLTEAVVHFLSGLLEGNMRISFIFTGSTNLENRKVDFWKALLGKSIYRNISYLSAGDTRRLITEPLAGVIAYPEEQVSSIYRLSGGHPFYAQVICQNLVDLLLEEDRTDPGPQDLEKVVRDIIENPLPQMIYSWNSLSDWTKFALSSLAGGLEDSGAENGAANVHRYLVKSKIALPFKRERLNVFLEEAYQKEFLRKSDSDGYSFRMDLYRRWIRKEHSIWKVIKEVNLEVKRQRVLVKYLVAAAAAVALAAVMIVVLVVIPTNPGGGTVLGGPGKISGFVLTADQFPFRVTVDGSLKLTSEGEADQSRIVLPPLEAGEHRFAAVNTVTNEEISLSVTVNESTAKEIRLDFEKDVAAFTFGSLFIRTVPEGAAIRIDGASMGFTPKVVDSLTVGNHRVELFRDGYKTSVLEAEVKKGVTGEIMVALIPSFGLLSLDIRPTAKVFLDGTFLVDTPIAKPLEVQTGAHKLLVVNESLGVSEEIDIVVVENETTKVERSYQ